MTDQEPIAPIQDGWLRVALINQQQNTMSFRSESIYYFKDLKWWQYKDWGIIISLRESSLPDRVYIPWQQIREVDVKVNSAEYISLLREYEKLGGVDALPDPSVGNHCRYACRDHCSG